MPEPSSRAAVIFDGDDTLWSTEPLYDEARQDAASEVALAGLNPDDWERLERSIDLENVGRLGFSAERFPLSCVQAYEALSARLGRVADAAVVAKVRAAAQSVFKRDAVVVVGARPLLERLRARGFRLGLLTKGDLAVQARRVERSGLAELFDVVHLVTDKPPAAFRALSMSLQAAPEDSWSVGNSVRSDILPAIEAGLKAIWVDAHVWEHERFVGTVDHDRAVVVADLRGVAAVVEGKSGGQAARVGD